VKVLLIVAIFLVFGVGFGFGGARVTGVSLETVGSVSAKLKFHLSRTETWNGLRFVLRNGLALFIDEVALSHCPPSFLKRFFVTIS
jgi:hypothetical protein